MPNLPRKKKEINILQIVVKNTSEMDYTLPLLKKLNEDYQNVNVFILYCVLNKKKILRNSTFFSNTLQASGIQEYDFLDFFGFGLGFFGRVFRVLTQKSNSDKLNFKHLVKLVVSHPFHREFLSNLKSFFWSIWELSSTVFEKLLLRLVDFKSIVPTFNPDLILLGNRSKTAFYGREHIYDYYYKWQIPVVLLPHGVHEVHPTKEFIPFDERGDPLPPFCDFWCAFQYETPWLNFPGKETQFISIGYPGLDQEWIDWLHKTYEQKDLVRVEGKSSYNCLVIIRKFLEKGLPRPEDFDPFTVNYEDMVSFFQVIKKSLESLDEKVDIVIKPHPSNNFNMIHDVLREAGVTNYEISQEPMYGLLAKVDLAISVFSTSLLMPLMYGIPVVLLQTKLQEYVNDRWNVLKQMYGGMRYYARTQEEVQKHVAEIVSALSCRSKSLTQSSDPAFLQDVLFLRQYYPDGACQKAIHRMEELLKQPLT